MLLSLTETAQFLRNRIYNVILLGDDQIEEDNRPAIWDTREIIPVPFRLYHIISWCDRLVHQAPEKQIVPLQETLEAVTDAHAKGLVILLPKDKFRAPQEAHVLVPDAESYRLKPFMEQFPGYRTRSRYLKDDM
jgi:hypothetical protein